MNTLLKLAVGAAIAGAVAVILKRRSEDDVWDDALPAPDTGRRTASTGYTVEEITGQSPAEWGGGSSGLNA